MQKSQKIRGCWIERTPFASSVMTAIIVFLVRFANGFDISGRHQCVCVLHGPRIQLSQKVLQVNNSVDLVCTSLLLHTTIIIEAIVFVVSSIETDKRREGKRKRKKETERQIEIKRAREREWNNQAVYTHTQVAKLQKRNCEIRKFKCIQSHRICDVRLRRGGSLLSKCRYIFILLQNKLVSKNSKSAEKNFTVFFVLFNISLFSNRSFRLINRKKIFASFRFECFRVCVLCGFWLLFFFSVSHH